MAVCNIFRHLSKETGTFLTFSQYMEDLTIWKTEGKYHKIVPSKFIAIDCKQANYNNSTLPKYIQEYFENACACFKNNPQTMVGDEIDSMAFGWDPEYTKTLFWNMMFETESNSIQRGLIDMEDIKYVGDINLQSYNTVDGMGYSEIYCHIPNEATSYVYTKNTNQHQITHRIQRNMDQCVEGFKYGELDGWELLSLYENYEYCLDKSYEFSWDNKTLSTTKTEDKSFNINMIVVLYDIWNDHNVVYSGIPLGMYITGLIGNNGVQNSITKYVSNEDIYNTGTSYGLRICSRYVVSEGTDNYIVKEVTVEDNNYGDLSRVLSQLSISQNKMDEVVNKTYNTEQNYKNLLAIFKNSRTNVPYIKIVNNESCWFVNGKLIGPSVVDGVYDSYTNNEIDYLLDSKLNQSFQIIASAQNNEGKYIFLKDAQQDIILKWDVYYEGEKINPRYVGVSTDGQTFKDCTTTNQMVIPDVNTTKNYTFKAEYGQLVSLSTVTIYFVDPIFFGEIPIASLTNEKQNNIHNYDYLSSLNDKTLGSLIKGNLQKYTSNTQNGNYEITTNKNYPGHICYAYPEHLGELRYITDMDGYMYYDSGKSEVDEITNSFIHRLIQIKNPLDGRTEDVNYHVYINKEPSYVYKHILKFKKQVTADDLNDYLN